MHGHSHGHTHNEKPDWLTNLGALGEAVEGLGNFFFGATVYNTLYQLCHNEENQDPTGPLIVGFTLSIISLGSAYTHRALDTFHQRVRCDASEDVLDLPLYEPYAQLGASSSQGSLTQPLNDDLDLQPQIEFKMPSLSTMQKFTLFGDLSAHICGRTGLMSGIVDEIWDTFFKSSLPVHIKAGILGGSFIFGIATSLSNVRTCLNVLREQNKEEASSSHRLGRR